MTTTAAAATTTSSPQATPPAAEAAAAAQARVGFTSQVTAGFRAVEQERHGAAAALVRDPLAPFLAGDEGVALARREWAALERAALAEEEEEGGGSARPTKHARIPARNRLVDDAVLAAVAELAHEQGQPQDPDQRQRQQPCAVVNVVNVGAGMDTKAWRLRPPAALLRVYDVDQPGVVALKRRLLREAGAALSAAAGDDGGINGSDAAAAAAAAGGRGEGRRFPLLAASYAAVGADLSTTRLRDALAAAGFDAALPTVFVAEALLYYLPLCAAEKLLADMRALLAPHGRGRLVATVIDRALLDADHQALDDSHYFAKMWHFCDDDLLRDSQDGETSPLARAGWALDGPGARTTAELCRERYGGAETFVPAYGGAELLFTASPA